MSGERIKEKARDYCSLQDFKDLLEVCEAAADSAWEIDFVSDIRSKFDMYSIDMYLSEKQWASLKRLEER